MFLQATGYMTGVLEDETWASGGFPGHPTQYREDSEAHENEAFLRVVELLEGEPGAKGMMPRRYSTWDPSRDPAWHKLRPWTLDSLSVLWGYAREYKPLPGRSGKPRDVVLIRKAGRLAMAHALRRNFKCPAGEADVITAVVELAEVEWWNLMDSDESTHEDFYWVRNRLLAGTSGIRQIAREANASGIVQQATERAEALLAGAARKISRRPADGEDDKGRWARLLDDDVEGACAELTCDSVLDVPDASGVSSLRGMTVAKDRNTYKKLLPNLNSLPRANPQEYELDRLYSLSLHR